MNPSLTLRDAALATAIAASWGVHFMVIRLGAHEVPPLFLLTLRYFLASLIFLPFTSRIDIKQIGGVASYALPYLILHIGLLFVALKYIEAGLASLIMQLGVPFIVLLGWVCFGEKFGPRTAGGLLLSMLGVVLIVYQPFNPDFSYIAAGLCVISAFGWAVGALRMRAVKDMNFATMTFSSHIIALPFALILTLIFETGQVVALGNAHYGILAFVLFYQVILMSLGLYLWRGLMHRNPAWLMTPFTLFVPVFGVLSGMIFLSERPGLYAVLGGLLVLVGVGIIFVRQAQKGRKL
ncbi:MAG: EamA family transporter [Alphaproteobacteria bacterium]|nr:EamA family transporter [Alphaproteobacteria bacterium]MCD8520505.1 EamA family transporter [Alphaproteobacteria bacterium]